MCKLGHSNYVHSIFPFGDNFAGTNLNLENNFGKNPINLANSRLKIVGEFESNSSMLKTKVMEVKNCLSTNHVLISCTILCMFL